MAISENPSDAEIRAALRRRALLYAENYTDETTAERFAEWYARELPAMDLYRALQAYERAQRKNAGISSDTLREWQYGAWMTNRTDTLQEITSELKRRGEESHAFFGKGE